MNEENAKDPRDLNGDGKVSLNEKLTYMAGEASDKLEAAASKLADDAKEFAGKAADKAEELFAEAKVKANEFADKASDKAKDLYADAKAAAAKAQDKMDDLSDKANAKFQEFKNKKA